MKRHADYHPFDYSQGSVQHVTLAMCRRLVRLTMKVARESTDASVVEEARRIVDELRAAGKPRHVPAHPARKEPGPQRPCACGCGTMIHAFDPDGRERRYVRGHVFRVKATHEARWPARAADGGKAAA